MDRGGGTAGGRGALVACHTLTAGLALHGHTLRMPPALHRLTHIFTLRNSIILNTLGGQRTVSICLTLSRGSAAVVVGVSHGAQGTETLVGAPGVVTVSPWATRGGGAEVYQGAAMGRVPSITRLAVTYLSMVFSGTQRKLSTRVVGQARYLAHVVLAELVIGAVVV